MASLGVGLQLDLDDSLRARIDYGIPLARCRGQRQYSPRKRTLFISRIFSLLKTGKNQKIIIS